MHITTTRFKADPSLGRPQDEPALRPLPKSYRVSGRNRAKATARRRALDPYWIGRTRGGGIKRAFDFIVASIMLLILVPVFLIVACLVALSGKGGIFYKQARFGRGGRAFHCLKFRTMAPNADRVLAAYLASNPEAADQWRTSQKLKKDPRVTAVGRFLRTSSLDELPQLWNVARGDMSLIGPRPVTRRELERYGADRVYYFSARPGITGLWQVSGRSETDYWFRVQCDRTYVRDWTFWRDVAIALKTVPVVLFGKDAY